MKTYIKPEMEINELELTEMIALSGGTDSTSLLGDGGKTSDIGFDYIEADSKQRGEGFDLLW